MHLCHERIRTCCSPVIRAARKPQWLLLSRQQVHRSWNFTSQHDTNASLYLETMLCVSFQLSFTEQQLTEQMSSGRSADVSTTSAQKTGLRQAAVASGTLFAGKQDRASISSQRQPGLKQHRRRELELHPGTTSSAEALEKTAVHRVLEGKARWSATRKHSACPSFTLQVQQHAENHDSAARAGRKPWQCCEEHAENHGSAARSASEAGQRTALGEWQERGREAHLMPGRCRFAVSLSE